MLAFVKARYTVGLIGLDIVDRAKVNIILEKAFADGEASWLALYNDSCDLIITSGNLPVEAMDEQIVARIVDADCPDDGPFLLRRPLSHEAIVSLLRNAEAQLDSSAPAPEYGRLKVTGVTEVQPGEERAVEMAEAAPAAAPAPQMHPQFAALGPSYQQQIAAQQAPRPYPPTQAQRGVAASANAGSETVGESWADISIALYSILQTRVPTMARINLPHAESILIDFPGRRFQCAGFPDSIPLQPHQVVLRATLAQPGQGLPQGQPLERLLWFIGTRALGAGLAPWLCAEDRCRLVQWPNFTVLDHSIDHMRMTAAMGNGLLTAEELSLLSGVPFQKAAGILNAFSLMGLLHIERQPAPAPRVPAPVAGTGVGTRSSGSLFGKLIRKMGL
ncbi:hypothetical protein [Croceicoccus mobilis]|uniref:Uncharacterized protein n=1 Tax=Croceicoccus mobilis TaxID=1703339 RepID=A0A917DUG0_9SPHN|nr:hypothetical protein [Croceicoccus mobilis]GGD69991.1 hypothetical protein GCM10010990_19390 [Croceicoccus mobilis]